MRFQLNEVQGKIDAKKKDIDELDERMKQLYARFDEMIPKEQKFYNYLLRVLNKKVKRRKRAEGEEADGKFDGMRVDSLRPPTSRTSLR